MTMTFDRARSRWAIWAVEALAGWIAFSSVFSDLFIKEEAFRFGSPEFDSTIEYVFRGNGFGTVSFWIRLAILIAFIGILVLNPWFTDRKNLLRLKLRRYAQFVMATGYVYVLAVFFAFGIFDVTKFRWMQAAACAIIFAIGYIRSSIEVHRYE